MHIDEFKRIGRKLLSEGLVGGNFGNMSVRSGDGFFITRTGSYLDDPGEPVFVSLDGPAPKDASSEYRVHREVYQKTRHNAIVHAHPAHAVALSIITGEIVPRDSEGIMLCPVIPVVQGTPGSDELAMNVSDSLCLSKLTIASGHGTFAVGKSLDEAYVFTSLAEHSCRVLTFIGRIH